MGDTRLTRKRLTVVALLGLLAVLALLALVGNTSGADYIGDEACGATGCHKGTWEDWRETMHGIDFATEWMRSGALVNKYTYSGGNDTTGAFGGCASCHVTGEGDTEHGGTIMTEPWNSTHNLPLGSIGCENCHGPGSDHAEDRAGNPEYMEPGEFTYSWSCSGWSTTSNAQEDRMGICHDGGRMGGIQDEGISGYYDSVHAGGIGSSSPIGNPDCYHCMASTGFISITINGEDAPDEVPDDAVYGIYCGACHDLHPDKDAEEIHFQLRAPEDELCELCHYNTHVFPDTHVRHPTSEFRHGINGKDVPVTHYMDEVSCPECHMFGTGHRGDPVIVGHSFNVIPQACVNCHSMYTNESAWEYVEGVQAEFAALLAPFGNETTGLIGEATEHMEWAVENNLWTDELNMTYLEGMWNYEYPFRDGSSGAHNPPYMRAMFASAKEKLEMVIEDTSWGQVKGTVKIKDGDPVKGAMIYDGKGMKVATAGDDGMFEFFYDEGSYTFIVKDSEGKLVGTMDATVDLMQSKDLGSVEFEKTTTGGDGDEEETDTMTYVFIGIIVLLIIILIVVAMMGGKKKE